jgi:hypothetical protein
MQFSGLKLHSFAYLCASFAFFAVKTPNRKARKVAGKVPCISLQVSFAKDRQVMGEVARNDIGEGANGNGVVAGDAAAQPGIRREIAKEGERG